MIRLSLSLVILAFAAISSESKAQTSDLFHVISDEAVRGPTLEILTSIRQDRASLKADAVMLHANTRQTLKQARFEISVPYLGKPVAFRTDGYWAKSDSLFIWQG